MIDVTQLKDKVIVITGASRGIGQAIAHTLKDKGVRLVLGARTIAEQSEFQEDTILHVSLDVSDEESVMRFKEVALARFGKVDVLINAAGVGSFSSILDSETKDFDDMISINLRGTYLTCKHFGRTMKSQQDGQILNLVSIAGTMALPGNGGYSASKYGVYGFTKVLQSELRREGIRITSVIPGAINSSFWDNVDMELDKSNMISLRSITEHILFLLCQPKPAVVDEITIMPPNGIL